MSSWSVSEWRIPQNLKFEICSCLFWRFCSDSWISSGLFSPFLWLGAVYQLAKLSSSGDPAVCGIGSRFYTPWNSMGKHVEFSVENPYDSMWNAPWNFHTTWAKTCCQTKVYSFIRCSAWVGFYSSDLPSFDDLCIQADQNFGLPKNRNPFCGFRFLGSGFRISSVDFDI